MHFLRKLFGIRVYNDSSQITTNCSSEQERVTGNLNLQNTCIQLDFEPVDSGDPPNMGNEKEETVKEVKLEVLLSSPLNYNYPEDSLFGNSLQSAIHSLRDALKLYDLPILWSSNGINTIVKDLAVIKNLFITGTQETGKSSFLHQIIISILINNHPDKVKFLLADNKGLEFSIYQNIEKQFLIKLPAVKNAILKDIKDTINSLFAVCIEMDNRYDLLVDSGMKNIKDYNSSFANGKLDSNKGHQYLPFIIVVIDDLERFTNQSSKEMLIPLKRILNAGYKVGIFIIISTSQMSGHGFFTNLLTMINQRAIFRLNSKDEYRKFFDSTKLGINLNSGSFLYNENGHIFTAQAILFPIGKIRDLVEFVGNQLIYIQAFLLPEYLNIEEIEKQVDFDLTDKDSLFEDAARLIIVNQNGSTALLQRRMKLGYHRAGRLMDQLEAAGIVGPSKGGKIRDVLIKTEADLQIYLDNEL